MSAASQSMTEISEKEQPLWQVWSAEECDAGLTVETAIASAFVDNIPFAATMIPVIQTLSALQGIDLTTLAWTLSMGTDIGGSATPIGASANVVGISVATKQGYPIGWGYYCKYAAPATIIVISISMVCIFLRYF